MLGNLLDPRGSGLLFFMFIRPQPYTCLGIECLKQVKLRRGTATLQWDASRLTSEASHPTVLPTAERCPIAQRFQTLTSFASLPPIAGPTDARRIDAPHAAVRTSGGCEIFLEILVPSPVAVAPGGGAPVLSYPRKLHSCRRIPNVGPAAPGDARANKWLLPRSSLTTLPVPAALVSRPRLRSSR